MFASITCTVNPFRSFTNVHWQELVKLNAIISVQQFPGQRGALTVPAIIHSASWIVKEMPVMRWNVRHFSFPPSTTGHSAQLCCMDSLQVHSGFRWDSAMKVVISALAKAVVEQLSRWQFRKMRKHELMQREACGEEFIPHLLHTEQGLVTMARLNGWRTEDVLAEHKPEE